MKDTLSPTHAELDQVSPVRQAPTSPADAYPTNPYWNKTGAETPSTLPDDKSQSAYPSSFDAHLIGAISEAVREAGQQHRDDLYRLLSD